MTRGLGAGNGVDSGALTPSADGDGECSMHRAEFSLGGGVVAVGACGQRAKGSASSVWSEVNRTADTKKETSKLRLN